MTADQYLWLSRSKWFSDILLVQARLHQFSAQLSVPSYLQYSSFLYMFTKFAELFYRILESLSS